MGNKIPVSVCHKKRSCYEIKTTFLPLHTVSDCVFLCSTRVMNASSDIIVSSHRWLQDLVIQESPRKSPSLARGHHCGDFRVKPLSKSSIFTFLTQLKNNARRDDNERRLA
jgi:hypothetical protein